MDVAGRVRVDKQDSREKPRTTLPTDSDDAFAYAVLGHHAWSTLVAWVHQAAWDIPNTSAHTSLAPVASPGVSEVTFGLAGLSCKAANR